MANNAFDASLFDGQQAAAQEVEKKDLERSQEHWKTLLGTITRIASDVHARSGYEGVGEFYSFVNSGLVDFRKTGMLNLGTPAPQREVPELQEAEIVELDDDTKERIGRLEKILGSTLVTVGLDASMISKIIAGEVKPEAAKEMVNKIVTASIASAEKPAPQLKDGEVVISEKSNMVIPVETFKRNLTVLKDALDGEIPTLSGLGAKMTVNGKTRDASTAYIVETGKVEVAEKLLETWTETVNRKQ